MIRRLIKLIFCALILLGLAGAFLYWQKDIDRYAAPIVDQLERLAGKARDFFAPPCTAPIYYSLGSVDPRFGLSAEMLKKTLEEAAGIWNNPVGEPLFAYKDGGAVKVNLIYDYRQAATDKLKKLGITVKNDRKSYDDLKARYDELNRQYSAQKAALDSAVIALKSRQAAYEAEVDKYNSRGGAPKPVYDRLTAERLAIDSEVARINALTDKLNQLAENINAESVALNQLIGQLNLNVQKYNSIGASTGEEFREGQYVLDGSGERIDIYQFNDHNQLVRLLAHEFGHAIGLEHTSSSKDIMYYLNDSENLSLSPADFAAIRAKCQMAQ